MWQEALTQCLGPEALDLETLSAQRMRTLGGEAVPLGFGDFFFSPEDPLHPDADEDDDDSSEL